MKTTRRSFLKNTAIAAGALSIPASSWARVDGANGDLRVAVIGFNGRGKDHIEGFRRLKGVRLVALCDVDKKVLEKEAARLADADNPVEKFVDVRRLLESKDIDAVSIATPNHWHSLMAIWACQHGKDVYVEKPVSHNVWEGRQIVNAARKHRRIVQTGTQSRSNPGLREAIAWLHAGGLGEIKVVHGLCYKPRQSIGRTSGPQVIPDSVDYDLWCGPSPTPVNSNLRKILGSSKRASHSSSCRQSSWALHCVHCEHSVDCCLQKQMSLWRGALC